METVYLSEADVDALLDIRVALDAVEEAFRRWSAGEVDNVPRRRARSAGIVLHSMSAAAKYLGRVGWKQYTTTRRGAVFHIGIYDAASGELEALIEANRLGQLRTGAATGVAVKHLAATDATTAGIFGTGWQAESQLMAIDTVRSLEKVFVYSRDAERRGRFVAKMQSEAKAELIAVDDARRAVEQLPIVVTMTNSRSPVFDGSWLAEGATVCAAGSNALNRAELDVTTVRRSSRVVCDSVAACRGEAGDFVASLEAGVFDWADAIDLSDVLAGKRKGRIDNGEIVIFKSVGLAIEDVALASRLIDVASKQWGGRCVYSA